MDLRDEYALVPEPPTLGEYLRLRCDSGLSPKMEQQGRGALAASWSFCHVRSASGEAVAMGRVIGDGGWYFHIADIATLPAHQRRGLGRRVLAHLLADIRDRAPENPFVNLIADPPGRRLYESMGFRETAPSGTGMQLVLTGPGTGTGASEPAPAPDRAR